MSRPFQKSGHHRVAPPTDGATTTRQPASTQPRRSDPAGCHCHQASPPHQVGLDRPRSHMWFGFLARSGALHSTQTRVEVLGMLPLRCPIQGGQREQRVGAHPAELWTRRTADCREGASFAKRRGVEESDVLESCNDHGRRSHTPRANDPASLRRRRAALDAEASTAAATITLNEAQPAGREVSRAPPGPDARSSSRPHRAHSRSTPQPLLRRR